MSDYNYEKIKEAYEVIGVKPDKTVYLTGNFGRLGRFTSSVKEDLFNAHLDALFELMGSSGTLVVPTHSFSLANTSKTFDYNCTPSETGPFSEFVRKLPGAVRQLHPFSSSTAIGFRAKEMCGSCTRHVYGWGSPFHKMVESDAIFVSVGKDINETISLVHHAEFMMGVPYRYTKEFSVNCRKENNLTKECFYLHVLYKECDIVRDRNEKITQTFLESNQVLSSALGRSNIFSLSMKDFFNHTVSLMSDDLYVWLKHPPEKRPYLK